MHGWCPHSASFCSDRKASIFSPRHSTPQHCPRLNHARRPYWSVWPGSTCIVVSEAHDVGFTSVLLALFSNQNNCHWSFFLSQITTLLPSRAKSFSQALAVRNESRRQRLISDPLRVTVMIHRLELRSVTADPSACLCGSVRLLRLNLVAVNLNKQSNIFYTHVFNALR